MLPCTRCWPTVVRGRADAQHAVEDTMQIRPCNVTHLAESSMEDTRTGVGLDSAGNLDLHGWFLAGSRRRALRLAEFDAGSCEFIRTRDMRD